MSAHDVAVAAAWDSSTGCRIEQGLEAQSICAVGEFGCQCARKCENGGVLDVDSCTCKCPGDHRHGWMGPDCREEYGSCQAGDGSTNKEAARQCVVKNKCDTFQSKAQCGSTEVCCAAHYGTTCCPFGSSCDCTWNKCTCAPGQ